MDEKISEFHQHHRSKRDIFRSMYKFVNGIRLDDDDSEEYEDDEEELTTTTTKSNSESVESVTTRFGRFISPLAFEKISETLGEL